MEEKLVEMLQREVVAAQGCTEPIAVSYAVSLAVTSLKEELTSLDLYLSTNIIKNAMGVGIPGTGEVGLEIAAALGAVILEPEKKLEILCGLTPDNLASAKSLMKKKLIHINHKQISEPLYIEINAKSSHHTTKVVIARQHTNIIYYAIDDEVLVDIPLCCENTSCRCDDGVTVSDILHFVRNVDVSKIAFLLDGAKMNKAVSDEGLKNNYGLQVGKKIMEDARNNLLANSKASQIIAVTSAASDARMDGCPMPIMTTAGSGNQGITCSLPSYELAEILGKDKEDTLRALALSQLMTIHIKFYIGRLSPLCGAGIAGATGSCCGMTYLLGGSDKQIGYAINNMLSDVSGMICDGAKSTCALKIATSINAAIQCANLAMNDISPDHSQGIVFDDAEQTLRHLDDLVKKGLCTCDETILDIMLCKC